MITLYKYLRESLLDDFDDLEKKSDNSVANSITKEPEFIHKFGEGWEIKDNSLISPSQFISTRRNYRPCLMFGADSPIKQFIPDTVNKMIINYPSFELRCKSWGKNYNISNKTVCDKIIHNGNGTLIVEGNEIKDIDFDLNSSNLIFPHNMKGVELNNVNIHFRRGNIISIVNEEFPIFNNVKSNAINMRIHDTFMFDTEESIKSMDKILDLPYKVKVYDSMKHQEVEIPIKTFKKIHAIVNNKKRYTPKEPLIKIKSNSSLNDIIDLSGFKDLKSVVIENNLIAVSLCEKNSVPSYYRHDDVYKFTLGDWIGYAIKK